MAPASELTILHLKDNHPNDRSQVEKITDKDRVALRYLSSHSLSEMRNDKGCDVLVFPHSFKETKDEIGDSYVLDFAEDKDGNPESITTGNLVGFIGYKGTEICIHSRFSSSNNDDFFLYYMLEKTMSINQFNLDTSSSKNSNAQVFDFLLFFFPRLLKEAMSQGMYKKYMYHEYNDANIRGVVDVNRHIRLNIPANGKIAYRTREFSYDNPVTQLIRHTIEFIRRKPFGKAVLHNDPDTEGYVQQIIQATPSFQPRQMQSVINENLRPVAHPYYTKYAALQKLCLRILRHEKLSYGENGDKIHGILIDAAWLWEEYVAGVISGIGGQHYIKPSPFWLFTKENEKGPFQQVIPDYMKGEDGKCEWIADAKYIPLAGVTHLPAEKAERVYYKTIMYMYRFCTETGFLFYPDDKVEQSNLVTFVIQGDRGGKLHMVSLAIPRLGKDYSSFKNAMGRQENLFKEKIRKKDGV